MGFNYIPIASITHSDPSGYLGADPWAAYIRATSRGYTGDYGSFSDQYYDQYYDYMFTGGGGGFSGSGGGGSTSMTFTYSVKNPTKPGEVLGEKVIGPDGETYYCPGTAYASPTYSTYSVTLNVGNIGGANSGAPMLESSYGSNVAIGMATIVDGAVIGTELFPTPIIPRSTFNNVAASAAAGKLIAQGNNILTWTAVATEGINLYNNQDKATKADYTKWGVNIGLATAGTTILAVATLVPGVNVVAWGIALFGVSTANNFGLFDPLYQMLNK